MGSTLSQNIIEKTKSSSNGLIVCQDNNQISNIENDNFKFTEMCCDFDSEKGKCVISNYITIFYPQSDTSEGYQFSIPDNYKDK